MSKPPKIAIITCIIDDWGGSEDLWAKSVHILADEGINDITIYKNKINQNHPEFIKLKEKGIKLHELELNESFLKKIKSKLQDKTGAESFPYKWNKAVKVLYNYLKASSPDLAIISQGINFDGLQHAHQCLKLNIPYITIAQKGVDFYWPSAIERPYMRETLQKAKKCLFVSQYIKTLTEEQFGTRLPNGEVVFNPVKTKMSPVPYPSTAAGYRLACIGRLFILDKGQDILLKVLSQQKWRDRNISVDFIGIGPDLEALSEMADMLEIKNVAFKGYSADINKLWENYHALVLPSRSEGLPLVVVEAMAVGRVPITTYAGGNAEIVEDQQTGFMGDASERGFGEAMERAWLRREEWESMGIKAAEYIKANIPQHPETRFVEEIKNILKQ